MATTTETTKAAPQPAAKPNAKQAAAAKRTPAENPRAVKARENFEEAKVLIARQLESGDWVPSNEIHRRFKGKISEGTYGRVKSVLGIEHRRVKGDSGPAIYEWRMPASK